MTLKDIFPFEDGQVLGISHAGHLHSLGYTAFYVDYIGQDSYENDSHKVRTKWIPIDTVAVVCEKRLVMYLDFPGADPYRIEVNAELQNIRIQEMYEGSFAILGDIKGETAFLQWLPENTTIVIHEVEQ